ncbi:CACYBP [Cordylochernes scorpioides]|uniref:CACYBP n=1 Tax=Cordylochernes scorpioides TaxID=51811 RepID=A0ABY6KQD8_9ARAC|nr:CACYBP [Cordylochernes scorpioides]
MKLTTCCCTVLPGPSRSEVPPGSGQKAPYPRAAPSRSHTSGGPNPEVSPTCCSCSPTYNLLCQQDSHLCTRGTGHDNYGWDQSEKYVKLYVSLNAVHTLAAEKIRTTYGPKMVSLEVSDLGGKSHVLTINNLSNPILPQDSYHKVKTDMVVIYLKKEKAGVKWDVITELEKKAIEAKDIQTNEEKENPEKTIMSLMKRMYDEGDDDMKRTIAKAWTEAQNKPMDIDP